MATIRTKYKLNHSFIVSVGILLLTGVFYGQEPARNKGQAPTKTDSTQQVAKVGDELLSRALTFSSPPATIGVIMGFRDENYEVSGNWKERTELYFSKAGLKAKVFIGRSRRQEGAIFCVNGKIVLFKEIPFQKETLDEVIRGDNQPQTSVSKNSITSFLDGIDLTEVGWFKNQLDELKRKLDERIAWHREQQAKWGKVAEAAQKKKEAIAATLRAIDDIEGVDWRKRRVSSAHYVQLKARLSATELEGLPKNLTYGDVEKLRGEIETKIQEAEKVIREAEANLKKLQN